ncbi:MAG: hypothetical protein ACI86M_002250 [Saprospiraceae bacterium]|jgi:hypothetical protein
MKIFEEIAAKLYFIRLEPTMKALIGGIGRSALQNVHH